MSSYTVSKCVCHKRSFLEIKKFANEHDIDSLESLQDRDYCCNGCGMCKPYVEMIFETGETEFQPGAYYLRNY